MKKSLWLLLFLSFAAVSVLHGQSAQFNFSLGSQSVSGWTNVAGDPSAGIITATSPSGIMVSSIATQNWVPYGSGSAFDGVGESGGGFFPGAVMANHWYQYGSTAEYNAAKPQLLISGLSPDSSYTIAMAGSSTSALNSNPVQYTVTGYNVYPSQYENNHNNTANGATFYNVVPDTAGHVWVYVNTQPTTDVADIDGLTIVGGYTSPLPKDSITSPVNGSVLGEDGNIQITATASIATGTITMVQFYHDTTFIGTSTTAPYGVTWYNPDPGNYQLIAKATDYLGRTATYSIRVTIASLNYFWSTTGNIATGGDTAFIGTVDTNRLAFRTNNVERMTILKDGTIGIGTKNTYGYQLAVNGTAIFTKAKVKTAGTWPDYVFKKEFVLPGLDDLERYVVEHHHLPGIASAQEVERDGIDIADHQAALLKEVEELTLYLIRENKTLSEQNKQVSEQAQQMTEQNRRIAEQSKQLLEQNMRLEAQQKEIDELKAMIKARN